MADAASSGPAQASVRPAALLRGAWRSNYFLLKKLHSLTGVVPIGAFLVVHLATNAAIVAGPEMFQARVDAIHALRPFLIFLEIFGIFVPIAFHAALGLPIWWTSKNNVRAYPYGGNIRYTLQRVSGLVILVFLVYHIWQMHWLGVPSLGGSLFDPHPPNAPYSAAAAIQRYAWVPWFYALGITAACYHLADGMWTFLISWGITVGPNAQRKAGWLCTVAGVLVCLVGLGALWTFATRPLEWFRIAASHG